MSFDVGPLVRDRRIVITAGSGGVGKTTTAAALGCAMALEGRRVLVLTIDPARRLANSLGLSELDNDPRRIDPALFSSQGMEMKGELWAMMLDTKRTFDQIVIRHAPRPELAQKILGNLIYQHLSDALAGTQEYMAMERLRELAASTDYDLIVLDTPPTQHALDFLDSPDRMMNMLDSGAIKALFGPAMKAGRSGLKLLQRGAEAVASMLERVTGSEFFTDMAEFFEAFEEMYDGFRNRSAEVKALLRDPGTVFFLVTSPHPSHVQEGLYFLDKIQTYGMNLGGFIINRTRLLEEGAGGAGVLDPATVASCLQAHGFPLDPSGGTEALRKLLESFSNWRALALQDHAQVEYLERKAPGRVKVIPYFDADIHDIGGLARLNAHLMG